MSLALAPRRGVSMLGLIMPIWGPKPFPQVSPWHLLKGVRANARPRPPLLKLCGSCPFWPTSAPVPAAKSSATAAPRQRAQCCR